MFKVSTTTRRSRRHLATLVTCCVALSGVGPAFAEPNYPAKIGDTPAEFGQTVRPHAPKIGDTPADFGKSVETPSLVEIVRPERTIVRDTDPALPIVLSALALLVALALMVQSLGQQRGLRTRAH
jgi:hypothetical protein